MHKVKNADFEEYRKYRELLNQGKILTPDGISIICRSNDLDPEKIGKNILETYNKFKSEGIVK